MVDRGVLGFWGYYAEEELALGQLVGELLLCWEVPGEHRVLHDHVRGHVLLRGAVSGLATVLGVSGMVKDVTFPKNPLSTNDLNIQFKGAATPGSLAGCLGTLLRDPEVAMPRAAACTDEMFICCL